MNFETHYFDWAATAIPDTDIIEKALRFSLEHWGNPSSIHNLGIDAKTALETARQKAANVLDVPTETIFFTSGGTESDHIPLLSLLSRQQGGSAVISAIEHPAMREMAKMLSAHGIRIITIHPDKDGFVSPERILNAIQNDCIFVSVMAVNNETGAIQPIYAIADALTDYSKQKRKPFFHIDCVQAAGKIPLSLKHAGIDSAALSAHKISGPRGIGILYLAKEMVPFLRGGGQEKNVRSGTENVFGAMAMALCLEKYAIYPKNQAAQERYEAQKHYTNEWIKMLCDIPSCSIIPHARSRLIFETAAEKSAQNMLDFSPWVVQASFEGIPGRVMQRALNQKGFYISTGSACSSSHHSHPALDAMNVSAKEKEGAVRFSFGHSTSFSAMKDLLAAIKDIVADFS